MMCILNICWWFGETLGSNNLAIHKDNWPTRNLSRAEKIACRVIEDGLILKGEWECAPVDLRKRVCVHELEEGWPRIGTKDVYLVAGALIEPSLQSSQQRADARGDAYLCNE